MKNAKVLFGALLIVMALATVSVSFGGNGNGNGNGPQSGSGGNSQNNGNGPSAWIYHKHGNGTYSMMQIPAGSIAGHAAHGDMWYYTGCPLTGPEYACW